MKNISLPFQNGALREIYLSAYKECGDKYNALWNSVTTFTLHSVTYRVLYRRLLQSPGIPFVPRLRRHLWMAFRFLNTSGVFSSFELKVPLDETFNICPNVLCFSLRCARWDATQPCSPGKDPLTMKICRRWQQIPHAQKIMLLYAYSTEPSSSFLFVFLQGNCKMADNRGKSSRRNRISLVSLVHRLWQKKNYR